MNRQVVGEVKNVEELCSVTWRVPEIDCASCEQRVTSKLAETEGIEDVEASSRSTKINLKYDTTIIYKKEIKSVIKTWIYRIK